MKKLTDNTVAVLEWMTANPGPHTPNEIGYAIGYRPTGGAQYRSRGPGSMIAAVLTNLERRKWIRYASRPDGLSGTAYAITDEGHRAIRDYTIKSGQVRRTTMGWCLVHEPHKTRPGHWWVSAGVEFPENTQAELWTANEVRARPVYIPRDGNWKKTFHYWPWGDRYRPNCYTDEDD